MLTNLAAALDAHAATHPTQIVVHLPIDGVYTTLTYAQLTADSHRYAHALRRLGLTPGQRVLVLVPPGPHFFPLIFGLLRVGVTLVFADPGIGLPALKSTVEALAPHAFIGVPAAHVLRLVTALARRTLRLTITIGPRWFWCGVSLNDLLRLVHAPDSAAPYPTHAYAPGAATAIIFTSGSTGLPKGVAWTHSQLLAQAQLLQQLYNVQPDEIDLPLAPVFSLFDLALGLTTIIPNFDPSRPARVDPAALVALIDQFQPTNCFTSPALLNTLGHYCQQHRKSLPSLRRLLSAGAPAHPADLARLQPWLAPGVEIHTPYGATEALPIASIGSHEILTDTAHLTEHGYGVCLGHPAPHTHIAIVPVTESALSANAVAPSQPPNEIGEIAVSGPAVTTAYATHTHLNAIAKIPHPDASTPPYHRTGDLGYLDAHNRLWYVGRKSHRVVTTTHTYDSACVEGIFNTHPAVRRTALTAIRRADAVIPVLCVELPPDARSDHAQLTTELRALAEQHAITRGITTVLFHPCFPVDIRHNSKIRREDLARWAAQRLNADPGL